MDTSTRNAHWRCRILFASCMLAGVAFPLAAAQSPAGPATVSTEEEIRLLRTEVAELRNEVNDLRYEMHRTAPRVLQVSTGHTAPAQGATPDSAYRRQAPAAAPAPIPDQSTDIASNANRQEADLAGTVGLVQSQVAELAQTKVESASKMPVKIYGTILSTTFFNTHDVDWADLPVLVDQRSNVFNTGSFSSSLRQSRIGLEIDGPTIGPFKSTGVFAVDFTGGQTDYRATPLFGLANIVYAYARLEGPRTVIEAGQDEMILAPHNPSSLVAFSYPELYRAGNLYTRAPQLRVEQRLAGAKEGKQLKMTLGLVAPIGTYPVLDFPGGNATNGWMRPAVQGRLTWQSAPLESTEQAGWEFGVSGHYGRVGLPQVDSSGNPISSFSAPSWAGAFDFDIHSHHLGFDAEGYTGENLQAFGGGIGQPGKTMGGYFEGRLMPTQRLQFNVGLGDDHLTRPDRIAVLLNRNTALFANTILQLTPEINVSLEYRHMVTRPFDGTIRRNDNVNLGIAYSF